MINNGKFLYAQLLYNETRGISVIINMSVPCSSLNHMRHTTDIKNVMLECQTRDSLIRGDVFALKHAQLTTMQI